MGERTPTHQGLGMIFGREHEFAALNAAYADMLAGHGSVLFLTGEAGLGKTTLVHAWAEQRDAPKQVTDKHPIADSLKSAPLDNNPSTLFLESACSIPIGNVDVGRLEALQPWADVVAQLHEKLSTQSTSKSKTQHKLNLGKLMRDSAPAWLWALPFVGEVAHAALVTARLANDQRTGTKSHVHSPTGPDPSSSPLTSNNTAHVTDERQFAAANQEQVFQQYVNLLTKISEATPLVIFLDDLHWADTSSCNLLFYLARQIDGKKILVIATYRQDDATSANDSKGHAIITVKNEILRYSTGKELALSYLNRDAIRAFLTNTFTVMNADGTLADYVADDTFEQWLHRISDGNSLFMTQFVRTLREDGHLDDNGRFVGDYATVVIPTSALAVVEERTRRLDADTRQLLMYATAEGEEFTSYVLSQLTEKKPMQLVGELKKAQRIGMITDRGTSRAYANQTTAIYGFSHALFHKALYGQLTTYEQEILHHQCFEILKAEWDRVAESKSRTTALATKLLAHAAKCEEWTTIAEVALAAAQEFWMTFNEDEALAMIVRVLEASDAAGGLMVMHATNGLTAQRAEALFLRGEIDVLRSRYDEATADYRAAEVLFDSAGIVDRAVDAVNGLAWTHIQTGSNDTALAESERALLKARAVGHLKGEANALRNIGNVYADRGAYDEALSYFERSLAIHTDIGNREGEAAALNSIGNVHGERGAYDEALSYYERSLAVCTAIGSRRGEANTLNNIGIVRKWCGAYDAALSYYEQSLAIVTAIGSRLGEANTLGNIGCLHQDRGAYDEALSYCERSLAIYTAIGNRGGEAITLNNIGCTLRLAGKISEAREYLKQSLALATQISSLKDIAETTAELGLLAEAESQTLGGLERDEKRAKALRLVEEALVMYRDLKLDKEIAECEKELDRIKGSA